MKYLFYCLEIVVGGPSAKIKGEGGGIDGIMHNVLLADVLNILPI
jgi:hypothetical protein